MFAQHFTSSNAYFCSVCRVKLWKHDFCGGFVANNSRARNVVEEEKQKQEEQQQQWQ